MHLQGTAPKLRGIALAMALVLMPICMILMYLFVDNVLLATRASMQERGRSQASHMAQSGLVIAYDIFQANNFASATAQGNITGGGFNITGPSSDVFIMPTTPGNMTFSAPDSQGWRTWTWDPSQPANQCFADGAERESISFRIYFTDPPQNTQWRIDCRARAGYWQQTQTLQGYIQNNGHFAIYSAGDLDDLSRIDEINVSGTVHANGNLYLFPKFLTGRTPPIDVNWPLGTWHDVTWPVQASVGTPSVNVTGNLKAGKRIIRGGDGHGEVVGSPQISTGGCPVQINGVSLAQNMDSNNPGWANFLKTNGLAANVTDGNLGGHTEDCFDMRAMVPGGYFHTLANKAASSGAGLVLNNATAAGPGVSGVVAKQFYNNAECRMVTYFEVDVAAVATSSNFVLYSLSPIRLVNAANLAGNLTVVSPATIYTHGNFNLGGKAAALITTDRIFHLSEAFQDTDPRNAGPTPFPLTTQTSSTNIDYRNFPPHAGMTSTPGCLTIQADLVDGVPAVHELNWSTQHSGFADPNNYAAPYAGAFGSGCVAPWQSAINCAACSDGLLEEFQQLPVDTNHPHPDPYVLFVGHPLRGIPNPDSSFPPVILTRRGSIMHLHCANMDPTPSTHPDTWENKPFVTPYLVRSYYVPYIRNYDSATVDPANPTSPTIVTPLYAPNIAVRTLWSVTHE